MDRMIQRANVETDLLGTTLRQSEFIDPTIRAWAMEHEIGFRKVIIAMSYARDERDMVLRDALRQTLLGLRDMVPTELPDSRVGNREGGQADYLLQMINKALDEVEDWPVDKIGRWIGFIQGVLYETASMNIRAERDRTRPLFHKAYKEMGIPIPESWEGK